MNWLKSVTTEKTEKERRSYTDNLWDKKGCMAYLTIVPSFNDVPYGDQAFRKFSLDEILTVIYSVKGQFIKIPLSRFVNGIFTANVNLSWINHKSQRRHKGLTIPVTERNCRLVNAKNKDRMTYTKISWFRIFARVLDYIALITDHTKLLLSVVSNKNNACRVAFSSDQ